MKLTLRAHPASISAAALKHDDPLRVLRVVNHVPSWARCSINVTKPDSQVTRLTFIFRQSGASQTPNVLPCLDGIVPEIFDCDSLTFGHGGSIYRLDHPRRALDGSQRSDSLRLVTETPTDDLQGGSYLVLVNYRRPFLLPEFTSADTIEKALQTHTLMHCGSSLLGERRITLSVLAEEPRTINRIGFNRAHGQKLGIRQTRLQTFTHNLGSDFGVSNLLLWAAANASAGSRFQVYAGAVPVTVPTRADVQSLFAPLRSVLDSDTRRNVGIATEVAVPSGHLNYDLDHSLVPDDNWQHLMELLRAWVGTLANSRGFQEFHASAQEYRDIRVADELHTRLMRLRRSRMVFYRGEPILQEPRSEKDVLALYFKLEGARALPLAHCRVLEHTPARGTDAIGHFRVSKADALNQYALIEFEYKFANFLTHGHSVRHVDLVICWTAPAIPALRSTTHPWLMTHSPADVQKTIPVVVLDGIPGLEVRSE